jgi:hypothetical protein
MKKTIRTVTSTLSRHQKELLFWGTSALVFLVIAYTALFLSSQILPNYEEDNLHSSAPRIEAGILEEVIETIEIVEKAEEFTHTPATFPNKAHEALETVQRFFTAYNAQNFETACRLLDPAKCNPESPYAVARLSQEYNKMVDGYENWNFWLAENTDNFHSDVVCVKYSYQYKDDIKNKQVHERLSFYVRRDENGNDRIYNRVCEKKFAQDAGDMPCPILSRRDFCLD